MSTMTAPAAPGRIAFTPEEIAEQLGYDTVAAVRSAITRGSIPSVRVGRRRFVPAWFVDQILNPPTNTDDREATS